MRLQISHFKKCSFLILTQNTHKLHTTISLSYVFYWRRRVHSRAYHNYSSLSLSEKLSALEKWLTKYVPLKESQVDSGQTPWAPLDRSPPPPCRRIILCHPRLIHATKNTVRHIPSGTYTRGRTYGKTYTRRKSIRERTIVGALVMCEELIC